MALVESGDYGGWELNVTLIDNGANTSTLSYALVAADHAAAVAAAATILTRIGNVTNAVVKGYSVVQRFIENALTLPGSGVHVEDRATVVLAIDGDPLKKVTVNIPAPKATMFVGTSGDSANEINTANTDLQAYAATWHTGGLAVISDGENVADAPRSGVEKGRRTHRRSSFG